MDRLSYHFVKPSVGDPFVFRTNDILDSVGRATGDYIVSTNIDIIQPKREDILKVIPAGTHDIEKFVSPGTLFAEAKQHKIILDDFVGFAPTFELENVINKEFGNFILTSNLNVNYGAAGIRI